MYFRVLTVSAVACSMMSVGVVPAVAKTLIQGEVGSTVKRNMFEGDWETVSGASTLIYRFQFKDGALIGWFVSSKNGQSYPLKNVRAKGKTLSFVEESTPPVAYTLRAQKGDAVLSGVSSYPDGEAVPRTLTRKQSQ